MEEVAVNEEEKRLGNEATQIELSAGAITINDDDGYAAAGELARKVKKAQKKVEEYWEPMRKTTYDAYKSVTDHKKEMMDPLKRAETVIKKKMSSYISEKERIRKAEEERIRLLAEAETERKLNEAVEAETNGDNEGAEYAIVEAEVMSAAAKGLSISATDVKAEGVSKSKTWDIINIDYSKVPTEMFGVMLRPVDEKAVMRLIKSSKGQIKIPGIEYEESYSISIRA